MILNGPESLLLDALFRSVDRTARKEELEPCWRRKTKAIRSIAWRPSSAACGARPRTAAG